MLTACCPCRLGAHTRATLLSSLSRAHSADTSPGQTAPFTITNIYNHPTLDSVGMVVNHDGSAVAFGRQPDNLMLWERSTGAVRKLASGFADSIGSNDISADGSRVVYASTRPNYNVHVRNTDVSAVDTIVNTGGSLERADHPSIAASGSHVVYTSNMPSTAKNEVFLYKVTDMLRRRITAIEDAAPCFDRSYRTSTLLPALQAFWGNATNFPSYSLIGAGISSLSSSSVCTFAAAAGIIPSANTIEPLMPTTSADGRYTTFVTNFDARRAPVRTHDASGGRAPATHIVYLYDRVLGLTVPVTMPTPDQISGVEKCCCDGCASSSYRTGSCSWLNRLQGKCCDQKPCRLGGLNSEISADGEKIVFLSDVDYGGA